MNVSTLPSRDSTPYAIRGEKAEAHVEKGESIYPYRQKRGVFLHLKNSRMVNFNGEGLVEIDRQRFKPKENWISLIAGVNREKAKNLQKEEDRGSPNSSYLGKLKKAWDPSFVREND